jgi:hypothetical protein
MQENPLLLVSIVAIVIQSKKELECEVEVFGDLRQPYPSAVDVKTKWGVKDGSGERLYKRSNLYVKIVPFSKVNPIGIEKFLPVLKGTQIPRSWDWNACFHAFAFYGLKDRPPHTKGEI